MKLENFSIHQKKDRIVPTYADACGNTFLIYDFIRKENVDWNQIKNTLWETLKNAQHIDDALLLRKVNAQDRCLEVKMHVLEPDGTEADFCGNGARSVGTYLRQSYFPEYSSHFLVSRRGKHDIHDRNGMSFINMGIPIVKEQFRYDYKGKSYQFFLVDAIEPHLVTRDFFNRDLLSEMGEKINQEMANTFPQGINVNCLQSRNAAALDVLTYERGLYRITQACGTGSTACCATAIQNNWISPSEEIYKIYVLGGQLELMRDKDKQFWLGGQVILNSSNNFR